MKRRILAGVLAAAAFAAGIVPAAAFDRWNDTTRYEFTYRVDLEPLLGDGQPVRLWLPTPSESTAQRLLSSKIDSPWEYRETLDTLGNRIVYIEASPKPGASQEVVAHFTVERSPDRGVPASKNLAGGPLDPARYLKSQRRIPLDGLIREIAVREGQGITDDSEKIRTYYDYVVKTMQYSKHGEGWGQGDAIWACTSKYGNCTDFHSLFIGMARSQQIPARFLIGFPIPYDKTHGTIPGYHCWAEVYDPTRGWFPFDASEAKKSGRIEEYFGALPSDRIAFTLGRDLVLEPPQAGEPINYFIYPYAEIAGKRVEKVPARFEFRRLLPATASR